MAVNLSFIGGAGWQFFDNDGVPLAGGKIYTYAAGTTTPLATYTSRTGLTANANPIILDAAGRTPQQVWSTEGLLYKYVVADANDVVIRTWDNIGGSVVASDLAQDLASTSDNSKGDALIGFKQSNSSGFITGATARTVNDKLQEIISVKDFGAVGNGVADDTAALEAAFAYCCSSHATLYFPPGTYTTTRQLNVTSGFQIVGSDEGSNQSTATRPNFACSIVWTGSAASTDFIIAVKSITANQWVMGFGIDKIALAGANLAYGCLHLTNIRYCNIGTIWADRGREYTVLIDDNNGSIICGQSQINVIYNRHDTGLGVVLRSNGGSGLTQININQIAGGSFEIGDVDSSVFGHIQVETLIFRGTGSEGNPRASRKNRVLWFAGGDVTAEAGSKNIIDWVNSEGTSVTINSEASLPYAVLDRKNGMRHETLNYRINDKYDLLPGTGRAQVGSPVYSSIGPVGYNALLFDDAAQELWQWSFRIPKHWREGKITKFEFLCYSANSGDVAIQIASNYRPIDTGIGTALTPTTYVNSIVGNATRLITVVREIEVSGISNTEGDSPILFNLRIGRDGADAADTLVGDWAVFGVRIHWWGNASVENPTFRYEPSPDVSSIT
jgi:hypothetical protein